MGDDWGWGRQGAEWMDGRSEERSGILEEGKWKGGINDVVEAIGARPIPRRGRRMKCSRRSSDEDAAVQILVKTAGKISERRRRRGRQGLREPTEMREVREVREMREMREAGKQGG